MQDRIPERSEMQPSWLKKSMSESYQAEALFQQLYEAVHSFYGLPDLPEREL